MPRLKTKKSVAKRIRITKNGKILKKRAGQDHFNARESGNTTRGKRRLITISKTIVNNLKKQLPYS